MTSLHRPLLRWFGGKWAAAPWIISHFPAHRVYVEAFGGAASILIRKPPSAIEVLNDLDDRLVALYRVTRDDGLHLALADALEGTLYARKEFELACLPTRREDFVDEDAYLVETARRVIVVGAMGYGTGKEGSGRTGFRDSTSTVRSAPVRDFYEIPAVTHPCHDRLRRVLIESRDAVEIMQRHDSPTTLHYVDPPYVRSTRSAARDTGYRHELDDAGHWRLLDALVELRGFVVVSGYAHDIYEEALRGWRRVERQFATQGKTKRTEVLWINPAAAEALDAQAAQPSLFEYA